MAKSKKVKEADIIEEIEKKKEDKEKDKVKVIKEQPQEKALFVQRFFAFVIDVVIVVFVASIIVYPFLDYESIDKLNSQAFEIINDYASQKISLEEYKTEVSVVSYELAQKQGLYSIVTVLLNVLYFVVFQLKNNGQTLGKQLLKIKVKSTTDSELSVNQMIFRSFIINAVLADLICFGLLLFVDKNLYFDIAGVIGSIQGIVIIACIFMVMFRKDRLGIHDMVAHTEVVRTDLVKEMEECES